MTFPTLAFQLAHQYPPFLRELLQAWEPGALMSDENLFVALCSQVEKFIPGPLRATRIQTLIIIGAIDKCGPEEPASAIL